jgi:hypothetical protein
MESKIWDFHDNVNINDLLGCAMLYFGSVPTFQSNELPLSLGLIIFCSEILAHHQNTTQRNNMDHHL